MAKVIKGDTSRLKKHGMTTRLERWEIWCWIDESWQFVDSMENESAAQRYPAGCPFVIVHIVLPELEL